MKSSFEKIFQFSDPLMANKHADEPTISSVYIQGVLDAMFLEFDFGMKSGWRLVLKTLNSHQQLSMHLFCDQTVWKFPLIILDILWICLLDATDLEKFWKHLVIVRSFD